MSTEEWRVSGTLGSRRTRLLEGPTPQALLDVVIGESDHAAREGRIAVQWQAADERTGYFRTVAQIPLTEDTFDAFFNGRSGYRAQYCLSPEEGVLYNRDALDRLIPAITTACESLPPMADQALLVASLRAPHAKLWVFGEQQAFEAAIAEALNPPRWVDSGATRGRRAPLPSHLMLDVKGAFLEPATGALFVDDLKLDRACDLFKKGFT